GLAVGAVSSALAVLLAVTRWVGEDSLGGWPAVVIGYPAAATVPLAFATMVLVSRFTHATVPANVARTFARMHLPERLGMGVERVPRG
ncbi:MAG: cation acetate symporter, partial [Mycobacterium sp.]